MLERATETTRSLQVSHARFKFSLPLGKGKKTIQTILKYSSTSTLTFDFTVDFGEYSVNPCVNQSKGKRSFYE